MLINGTSCIPVPLTALEADERNLHLAHLLLVMSREAIGVTELEKSGEVNWKSGLELFSTVTDFHASRISTSHVVTHEPHCGGALQGWCGPSRAWTSTTHVYLQKTRKSHQHLFSSIVLHQPPFPCL